MGVQVNINPNTLVKYFCQHKISTLGKQNVDHTIQWWGYQLGLRGYSLPYKPNTQAPQFQIWISVDSFCSLDFFFFSLEVLRTFHHP